MTWDGRIRADARHLPIADGSVQCVITSPPYWALRDYGQDGQIGLEATPEEYVATMRSVASEIWRVLKPDGTLWLNLGDSYSGKAESGGALYGTHSMPFRISGVPVKRGGGLKPKDLVGIPWRVAFALQADGWYLRSDIIWHKPNPMPESVTDRPTKAHEYLFLLSKNERYFYDAAAIAELSLWASDARTNKGRLTYDGKRQGAIGTGQENFVSIAETRNKRSVWTVSTQSYAEAHYATFPPDLVEPCILAGSRPGDIVLDPFFGSGTVGMVAEKWGRRWVGTDLGYQDLQAKRLRNLQRVLVARCD